MEEEQEKRGWKEQRQDYHNASTCSYARRSVDHTHICSCPTPKFKPSNLYTRDTWHLQYAGGGWGCMDWEMHMPRPPQCKHLQLCKTWAGRGTCQDYHNANTGNYAWHLFSKHLLVLMSHKQVQPFKALAITIGATAQTTRMQGTMTQHLLLSNYGSHASKSLANSIWSLKKEEVCEDEEEEEKEAGRNKGSRLPQCKHLQLCREEWFLFIHWVNYSHATRPLWTHQ